MTSQGPQTGVGDTKM